jgi:hypothetical protein
MRIVLQRAKSYTLKPLTYSSPVKEHRFPLPLPLPLFCMATTGALQSLQCSPLHSPLHDMCSLSLSCICRER